MTQPEQRGGGNWDSQKNWKKIREKHHKHAATGNPGPCQPTRHIPDSANNREGTAREISDELYDLNYELAFGRITEEQYERAKLDLGKRD